MKSNAEQQGITLVSKILFVNFVTKKLTRQDNMIKPTELRIGNIVYPVNPVKNRNGVKIPQEIPFVVAEIIQGYIRAYPLGKNITEIEDLVMFDLDLIAPIPLTVEWLKRFGFKRNMGGLWTNGISIRNPIENIFELRVSDGFGYINIRYVHQLQNLFYSLTGQELEWKQKTL